MSGVYIYPVDGICQLPWPVYVVGRMISYASSTSSSPSVSVSRASSAARARESSCSTPFAIGCAPPSARRARRAVSSSVVTASRKVRQIYEECMATDARLADCFLRDLSLAVRAPGRQAAALKAAESLRGPDCPSHNLDEAGENPRYGWSVG